MYLKKVLSRLTTLYKYNLLIWSFELWLLLGNKNQSNFQSQLSKFWKLPLFIVKTCWQNAIKTNNNKSTSVVALKKITTCKIPGKHSLIKMDFSGFTSFIFIFCSRNWSLVSSHAYFYPNPDFFREKVKKILWLLPNLLFLVFSRKNSILSNCRFQMKGQGVK